jgi:hypothetical protein
MTKDCGCGEKGTAQSASAKTTTAAKRAETQISASKDAAATNGTQQSTPGNAAGVSVGGPIVRLHAADGLFLRAEHLEAMQDYAYALSTAVGIAVGTGVVYGFQLGLQDGALTATEGLALTPTGQPLQSNATLRLPLDTDHLPTLDQDDFWLVVIEPATEASGSENAYGTVCADPCEGIGSIKPWLTSLVTMRLLVRPMPGLKMIDSHQRRSWLASQYFEQERRDANPWVVPKKAGGGVAPLLGFPWAQGGIAPEPQAVPIGVLHRIAGKFVIDTWTARREVSGPPGAVRWAGHLAMRPWPVFLAQVLQFQDQLRSSDIQPDEVTKQLLVDPREQIWKQFFEAHPTTSPVGRLHAVQELAAQLQAAPEPHLLQENGSTFHALGFGELPPAGYLAPILDGDAGKAQVDRLFAGTAVKLRFCQVRADYVAGAVQAGQHLDRIPLDPQTFPQPEVDILVPSVSADLAPLKTDSYGWVAFVRRSAASCDQDAEPETELVEVYRVLVENLDKGLQQLSNGDLGDNLQLLDVTYPKGQTDLPAGIAKPPQLDGLNLFGVAAVAADLTDAAVEKLRGEDIVKRWQLKDPQGQFLQVTPVTRPDHAGLIVIFGPVILQ